MAYDQLTADLLRENEQLRARVLELESECRCHQCGTMLVCDTCGAFLHDSLNAKEASELASLRAAQQWTRVSGYAVRSAYRMASSAADAGGGA